MTTATVAQWGPKVAGTADSIYSRSNLVIPSSLKYTLPKHGPSGTRQETRHPPLSSSYSTSGDKIVRFHFTADNLVDCRRGFIAFDLTLTGSNGTYCRVSQGIWSIFNRIRLVSGGQEVEDIREYNLLASALFEAYRDEDIGDVIGPSCYGFATQAERNAFGASTKHYSMPLFCGFFLTGIIPMAKFKRRLQLELYLADPQTCIETDSTNPITMTINNIYFHYEVVRLSDGLERELMDSADSGVAYPYKKFTYYVNPITSAKSQIVIPHISCGIENLIHIMRRSDNLASTTTNDKFLTYSKNNCTQFQLRINNTFFPPEPISATTEQAYLCYLRWIGKWKFGGIFRGPPSISLDDFNNSLFYMVNQLETHPGEGLINGFTTEGAGTNVYLQLDLAAPPANPTHLETFVQSYDVIDFSDGKLQ